MILDFTSGKARMRWEAWDYALCLAAVLGIAIRIALVVIAILWLTGCGERARQWNEGAAVKLTISSPALVARDARLRGATYPAGYGVDAWYDREQYEIRLPDSSRVICSSPAPWCRGHDPHHHQLKDSTP